MNDKTLIKTFLLAILIFAVLLIPLAIFNLSFAKFTLTYVPFLLVFVPISIAIAITIIKNKNAGISTFLFVLLFLTLCAIAFKIIENQDVEKAKWNSPNDRFTMDFIVGNDRYIYLRASVDDSSGLFLFDTGAGITIVNERLVPDKRMKLQLYTIADAKGMQQTKHLFKIKKFKLGNIEIKRLHVYPNDSSSWIAPKGIFYTQDSIIGVIGNNIISKYIWDFDLVSKRVTISKSKKYCETLPDSLSVKLISNKDSKYISVKINGVEKIFTFDFGSTEPLIISDSIPNKLKTNKGAFIQYSSGALNHIDTSTRRGNCFDFVDVKFGAFIFKEVKCSYYEKSNLFGIPFIWAFKRVVVDYPNNKAYFIEKNENPGSYMWHSVKAIEMPAKPKGRVLEITSHDKIITRYIFYGNTALFPGKSDIDSVFYEDSLLLPNGKIKYGPSILKLK